MAHLDVDDGSGSLAGSPGKNTLTGDKLRRRPAHSRKASVESIDLENDTLLPALERLQIYASPSNSLGGSVGKPPRRSPSFTDPGGGPEESIGSVIANGGGDDSKHNEVTSAEKPSLRHTPSMNDSNKIRANVYSGGTLLDKDDGTQKYKGGDTRLVSVKRGVTFSTFAELVDVPSDQIPKHRIVYRDPNDPITLIRVTRDDDIDELFEEWERYLSTLGEKPAEKLKIFVVEKTGSNDSVVMTPRANDDSPRIKEQPFGKAKSARESASVTSGLQAVPSCELTLVHRLGGGAFGEVHLALWRGSEVAVKFLHQTTSSARFPRRRSTEAITRGSDVKPQAGTLINPSGNPNESLIAALENPNDEDLVSGESSEDEREEEAHLHEELASRQNFLKEAKVMAALQHPNVVFVYGVVDDSDKLGIVEEFMRSGSLRRLLNLHVRELKEMKTITEESAVAENLTIAEATEESSKKDDSASNPLKPKKKPGKRFLSSSTRARCALDIARGMAYLHSRRFVHFDLKCDNVLTARQLGIAGGVTCKVADFGLSKQQKGTTIGAIGGGGDDHKINNPRSFTSGIASQRGTLPWTAPELFSDPSSATEKVDIYSFGVTMWELWTCDVPFNGLREQSVVWGIMTGKRPEMPSDTQKEPFPGYKGLMELCWSEDPKGRPTFDEVVATLELALTENGKL